MGHDKINNILNKIKAARGRASQGAAIGLDIGTSSIKLVWLQTSGAKKILKKSLVSPIPSGADLSSVLEGIVKSEGLKGRPVNVSLSGPAVVMRYITLPLLTPEELKNTLQFEAKEYLPLPLEEMFLDCAILKEKPDEKKMSVLLAAVKKSAVSERLVLLEKAGLNPGIIDVDCLCIANSFTVFTEEAAKKGPVALLNIGAKFTNMCILEDGILNFSRDILFGGSDVTQKISSVYNIDLAKAEAMKLDPQKRVELLSILEPLISHLSSEIRLAIDYYENQSGLEVFKIFVSGGLSYSAGVLELLNSFLGVSARVFDISAPSDIKPGPQAINTEQALSSKPQGQKIDYPMCLEFEDEAAKKEYTLKSNIYSVALGLASR